MRRRGACQRRAHFAPCGGRRLEQVGRSRQERPGSQAADRFDRRTGSDEPPIDARHPARIDQLANVAHLDPGRGGDLRRAEHVEQVRDIRHAHPAQGKSLAVPEGAFKADRPGIAPDFVALLPSRIAGLCSSADSARMEGTLLFTVPDSGLGIRDQGPRRRPFFRRRRRCQGMGTEDQGPGTRVTGSGRQPQSGGSTDFRNSPIRSRVTRYGERVGKGIGGSSAWGRQRHKLAAGSSRSGAGSLLPVPGP